MRPLPVFYILVFYIFIQFGWWAYLLVSLNNEVAELKTEALHLSHSDETELLSKQTEFNEKLHKRWVMVIGEGTVFLMFLFLGIVNVRRALKREEELAFQQKNFLHSITHELKSPLASIKLYLQTLQRRDLEKEKQQLFLHNALHDTDRLTQLVDNILIAAQFENRSIEFRKEKISFSEILEKCILKTKSDVERKANIHSDLNKDIFIVADENALVSLANNLIENAIKYSPQNSKIVVALTQKENEILLQVSDEGYGIPDSEKKNIFQKFYRIGNEDTRTTKGTGLGLFIVKQIADSHNAKIFVRNNIPKGSIFEVIFIN